MCSGNNMIYCGDLRDLFEAGRRRASSQAHYQVFGNGLTLLVAATDESKLVAAIQVVPGLLTVADSSVLADYCEVPAEVEQMQRAQRHATDRAIAQAVRRGVCGWPGRNQGGDH